ncbi:purple acid phosphatase family protein [Schlesneria paludicola]|uniref:purple acid phosphatase family protein n=1 Tax=Schlesneria paludicola TaxID=360056 RepID=UPI000299ECD8|nr:metallophosphoesterase family protein [Schlesneria paludicola]
MFQFRNFLFAGILLLASAVTAGESFRVLPYVQNPAPDAMTVIWFSEADEAGKLTVELPEGAKAFTSKPVLTKSLAYNPFKPEPGEPHPSIPWMHRIRVTGLTSGATYAYHVQQGAKEYSASFRTSPSSDRSVRFMVYSDSETEPESSTTPPVEWPSAAGSNRPAEITKYLVDQTIGYQENCRLMASRNPDFLLVTGDLVETGGEQRDWDEFWRHNAGELGQIASGVPILPAIGNHENFAGPGGGYSAEGANFATDKYLTYFEVPSNHAKNPKHHGRYYRVDYGPITIITVDSSDGLPHKSASDTNHNLDGSNAPDFNPGSEQYQWLESQLADARTKSRFTFVQFHHTMYGSGPHSIPFGNAGFSGQSGIAMRALAPLFFQYGVDIVFSGHDEMLERSHVTGMQTLADGTKASHQIHFYDVGIGGDGLRGPSKGFDNPFRKFLAHDNSLEVWVGKQLISGGKHYGHLEVNVAKNSEGVWETEVTPVQLFPRTDEAGEVIGWERRAYDDLVKISSTRGSK